MEKEIYPHEEEVDRRAHVPSELGRQIERRALEAGLYAANLPESVGGGGLSYASMAVVEREYGKTSHALHAWIGRPTEILLACEGDQRERYLLPCVRAEKREVFALTEPEGGVRHHVDEDPRPARRRRLDPRWRQALRLRAGDAGLRHRVRRDRGRRHPARSPQAHHRVPRRRGREGLRHRGGKPLRKLPRPPHVQAGLLRREAGAGTGPGGRGRGARAVREVAGHGGGSGWGRPAAARRSGC